MPRDDAIGPRTGTTLRGTLRRAPPPSDPRLGLALIAGAALLGIGGLAWVFGAGAIPGPSPTPTPTVAAVATRTPVSTSSVPADPTSSPTPGEPSPTPGPDASPTPALSPTPGPEPTAQVTTPPTPSIVGLTIDFPADGETVVSRTINVIGTGPPGATVTRDIPLWLDDHTTVRDDGLWMLRVELGEGHNELTFRIADDRSTERRITVVYRPGG